MKDVKLVLGIVLLALVGFVVTPVENKVEVVDVTPATTQPVKKTEQKEEDAPKKNTYFDPQYPNMTGPTEYMGMEIKDMHFDDVQKMMIDGEIPEIGTLDENGQEITLGMYEL